MCVGVYVCVAGAEGLEPSLTVLGTAKLTNCSMLLCAPVNPVLLDFVEEIRNFLFSGVKRVGGCFRRRYVSRRG